jgi:hypothetical protein
MEFPSNGELPGVGFGVKDKLSGGEAIGKVSLLF